jgi:hypothetical protein
MGLDLKLMALGYMGEPVYEQTWRSQSNILRLVRLFNGKHKEPSDFEEGTSPIVLSGETVRCMYKFMCDPELALHLWDKSAEAFRSGQDEYYEDVLCHIRDQLKEAVELSNKELGCVDFLFYMSY